MPKKPREPRAVLNAKITARRAKVDKWLADNVLMNTPTARRMAYAAIFADERPKKPKRKPRARLIHGSERAKAAAAVGVEAAGFRKEYRATFLRGPGRLRDRHQYQNEGPRRAHVRHTRKAAARPYPWAWQWKRAVDRPSREDKAALDADYQAAIARRARKNANRDRCWTGARGQLTSSAGDHHA